MDIVTTSESSKANKARKKKESDPLEVERQKELVRLMNRWFSNGKGRTQGKLHAKTGVATTTISDAFKPGTITNTENTLAILEIVASPKALTFFVIKFFPTMLPALEFAYNARLKKIALYDEFVKFADKFIDEDGELRQEKLDDFRKICESEFEKGLLYKNVLIGGKIRGLIIETADVAFKKLVDGTHSEATVKVGDAQYSLSSIDLSSECAVFKDAAEENWVIVVSDRSIAVGNAPAEYSERPASEEIVTEDRQ